jgi:hypothetical protein
MFENVQVGDKVWSIADGWGEVYAHYKEELRPLCVSFPHGFAYFTYDGRYDESTLYSILFWDEVKFETPKRKITKTFEGYVNIYNDNSISIYLDENEAIDIANENEVIAKGIKVTGEYEDYE